MPEEVKELIPVVDGDVLWIWTWSDASLSRCMAIDLQLRKDRDGGGW